MTKDEIKLRVLGGGAYPGFSAWLLNLISNVLVRERQEEIPQREEDAS